MNNSDKLICCIAGTGESFTGSIFESLEKLDIDVCIISEDATANGDTVEPIEFNALDIFTEPEFKKAPPKSYEKFLPKPVGKQKRK